MQNNEGTTRTSPVRVGLVALPLTAWGLERLVNQNETRLLCVGVVPSTASAAMSFPALQPDVVLIDLDGESGLGGVSSLHGHLSAKVLVLTSSADNGVHDGAVLAGARGVVAKSETPDTLLKAIQRVHEGEMWIDRSATSRIFMELAKQSVTASMDPAKQRIANLTPRELQTVTAMASDPAAPGKTLAKRLHISEHTLRNHLTSIYGKLGVANRVELYAYAHRHGLSRIAK